VQGSTFSNVLLSRVEFLSNQFRSVVRNPSARTVALPTADREIDAAMLLTRALLTYRNTLAQISVLPPEVFSRIFHLVALEKLPFFESRKRRWIRVTHVCRHWRQVALDDSSLWARISGYQKTTAWISLALARARNAPLAIDLGTPNAETLAMVPAHFAHTREFRLHDLVSHDLDDNIRKICNLEAPALEHFELGSTDASPVTFIGTPFFNGMAPKLRTFSLSGVCVPWSFIPCGQLTQLEITLINERFVADGPSPGDSKSLIDLLINCPVLEILVLDFCLPHSIIRPSHVQAIHLPCLSFLSLGGSSSRVANLLKVLKLPPSTRLRMRCTSENTAPHHVHHLLPLVSAHFHNPASVEMKSLEVILNRAKRLMSFTAYTYLPRSTYPPLGGGVHGNAALALSFDAEVDNGVDILGRVCSMLPISKIEYLSISAPDTVRSANWSELFQRCAKLTTIEAFGRGTSGLLKDLTPPKPKQATSGGKVRKRKLDNRGVPAPAPSDNVATAEMPMPIFPRLASLFSTMLDFGEPAQPSGTLYGVLSTTLRRRKACKVPLKTLNIDHCIITTNLANALGKLVPEFLWNDERASFDEFNNLSDVMEDTDTENQWGDYLVNFTQTEWWENNSDEW
jgi:hypothetical protein